MMPSRTCTRSTRPITSRFPPNSIVVHSRHSNATGASAIRGGFTTDDATAVSPAASSSFSPGGSDAAHAFIAAPIGSSIR